MLICKCASMNLLNVFLIQLHIHSILILSLQLISAKGECICFNNVNAQLTKAGHGALSFRL